MTTRKKNAVLYEVCKYIVNLNLEPNDLRNLLSSIDTGEFTFLLGKVVSSLYDAASYDQKNYGHKKDDVENTLENFLNIIKQKMIPSRVINSYIESLGFQAPINELGFLNYLREFIRQSNDKNLSKFLDFIIKYNGKDDPYLSMAKK
ncbi:hypothetical protein [Gluconobacter kondonii]|uniref:hypothetical protein n=1 Tax=Gluconobacter kondonii TaxID=941463 RepID=UPI00198271DD|nr:hypothetical protein [Gluconobacter kondonii]MBN3868521.1 hypothetical protein [Gluconobacter kondonii]